MNVARGNGRKQSGSLNRSLDDIYPLSSCASIVSTKYELTFQFRGLVATAIRGRNLPKLDRIQVIAIGIETPVDAALRHHEELLFIEVVAAELIPLPTDVTRRINYPVRVNRHEFE